MTLLTANKKHFDEWVIDSAISPEIAELNISSVDDPAKIAEFLGWKGYQ